MCHGLTNPNKRSRSPYVKWTNNFVISLLCSCKINRSTKRKRSKFEINIYIWIHIWNTINSTSLNVKQNNLWNSNPVYNENLWRKDQFTKELICPMQRLKSVYQPSPINCKTQVQIEMILNSNSYPSIWTVLQLVIMMFYHVLSRNKCLHGHLNQSAVDNKMLMNCSANDCCNADLLWSVFLLTAEGRWCKWFKAIGRKHNL